MPYLTLLDPDTFSEDIQLQEGTLTSWKTRFFLGPLANSEFAWLSEVFEKFRTDTCKEVSHLQEFFDVRKTVPSNFTQKGLSLRENIFFCESAIPPVVDSCCMNKPAVYEYFEYPLDYSTPIVQEHMVLRLWDRMEFLGLITPLLHQIQKHDDSKAISWVQTAGRWLNLNRQVIDITRNYKAGLYESTIYNYIFEPTDPKHPYHETFKEVQQRNQQNPSTTLQ